MKGCVLLTKMDQVFSFDTHQDEVKGVGDLYLFVMPGIWVETYDEWKVAGISRVTNGLWSFVVQGYAQDVAKQIAEAMQ